MTLIISHRAIGVQCYNVVLGCYQKNLKHNDKDTIGYFLGDFIRNHVDMVEVDVWYVWDALWVGHDGPMWKVNYHDWYENKSLIVHCKNMAAVKWLEARSAPPVFDYFYHDKDEATFTKKGKFWVHWNQVNSDNYSTIPKGAYVVMPPWNPSMIDKKIIEAARTWGAVCTDFPEEMDKILHE
jgi:hypothetical protein